jgi:hypothetical protein
VNPKAVRCEFFSKPHDTGHEVVLQVANFS